MNERIQKLALQAGAYWNHGDFNMGSTVEFQEGDLEKFAESIIQECIEELEISKKGDIYTGDLFDCEWNDCIDRQIEMLKEEFGVK